MTANLPAYRSWRLMAHDEPLLLEMVEYFCERAGGETDDGRPGFRIPFPQLCEELDSTEYKVRWRVKYLRMFGILRVHYDSIWVPSSYHLGYSPAGKLPARYELLNGWTLERWLEEGAAVRERTRDWLTQNAPLAERKKPMPRPLDPAYKRQLDKARAIAAKSLDMVPRRPGPRVSGWVDRKVGAAR